MQNYDLTATASATDDTDTELIAAPSQGSIVLTSLNFTNKTGSNDYVDVLFDGDVAISQLSLIAGLGSGDVNLGRGVLVGTGKNVSFQAATGGSTIYANATYFIR